MSVGNVLPVFAVLCLFVQMKLSLGAVISAKKISEIVAHERSLIQALGNYIQEEELKGDTVDETIKSFQAKVEKHNLSSKLNPIDAFLLQRRIVEDWEDILENVLCEDCAKNNGTDDIERALYKCHHKTTWPQENDVTESAMALIRLCRVYNLNLDDVINGKLEDITANPLTYDDIIYIGNVALEIGHHYETVGWITAGFNRVNREKDAPDNIIIKLYKELAAAYNQNGMSTDAEKIIKECADIYPDSKSVKRELQYYQLRAKESSKKGENTELKQRLMGKAVTTCELLCRGENFTESRRSMICRIRSTKKVFEFVKEEILSWKPRVVIFHDVISESEMDHIVNISSQRLDSSGKVVWRRGPSGQPKGNHLYDKDPVFVNISSRMENITGLISKHRFQVINMGLGDKLRVTRIGNSKDLDTYYEEEFAQKLLSYPLATWMYFLTDSTEGDIAFPDLKIRVPAKKGNAVFWYHLKNNGEAETRSRHCQCPVLLGSKWVAYKNIVMGENISRTNCGTERTSAYQ